jgi:hypothetical protein
MKLSKSTNYPWLKLLVLALSLSSWMACKQKDPDCYQSVVVNNYSTFFVRDIQIDTLKVDTFTTKIDTVPWLRDSFMKTPEMYVLDEDSLSGIVIYGAASLYVPLDPARDSIRYLFRTDTTATLIDTLTFYYTPVVHFINNSCGYTYYYNLQKVITTHNMLDSAAIVSQLVSGDSKGNVNFYFKKTP